MPSYGGTNRPEIGNFALSPVLFLDAILMVISIALRACRIVFCNRGGILIKTAFESEVRCSVNFAAVSFLQFFGSADMTRIIFDFLE